jgi:hypothetical protein
MTLSSTFFLEGRQDRPAAAGALAISGHRHDRLLLSENG